MRTLILSILLALAACGGGTPQPYHSGQVVEPAAILDHPSQIVVLEPAGHRVGNLTFDFDLDTGDFLRCVGNGHFVVMLNADPQGIATEQYRGSGWILGRFGRSPVTDKLPDLQPVAVLETWANGAAPPGFESILSQSQAPIADGVHHVTLRLTPGRIGVHFDDFDSGDVPHLNPAVDESQVSIAVATVGVTPLCPYSIRIFNPVATWSPT